MTAHNIFETNSSQYFQLTNSEKKVADYVLRHRIDVQYMSISELAEECTVADATISRFCRRLGLTGYNAFKLELAKASMTRDSHRADAAILQESSGFHAMCKKLLGENVAVLEQTILDRTGSVYVHSQKLDGFRLIVFFLFLLLHRTATHGKLYRIGLRTKYIHGIAFQVTHLHL